MNRLGHKLLALAVIFVAIFTSTALPIRVSAWFERRGRRGRAILSGIMCFGGGVFLGTFLLHMTPEVDLLVSNSLGPDVNYPVAHLVIGAGFFFMMVLERGTLELQKWKDRRSQNEAPGIQVSDAPSSRTHKDQPQVAVIAVNKSDHAIVGGAYLNGATTTAGSDISALSVGMGGEEPVGDSYLAHSYHEGHSHHPHHELEHSHEQGSAARSLVLLLALSIDSLFEGLSLGLQLSMVGVWRMVLAILSHEIAVAFSLGLQIKRNNTAKRTLFMAFSYGMMSPIGIVIGIAVVEGANTSMDFELVYGILLGLTAGVFLYVAFFEILLHEISHESSIFNLLAVFVGFGVMAGLLAVHNQIEAGNPDNTPPGNASAAAAWHVTSLLANGY